MRFSRHWLCGGVQRIVILAGEKPKDCAEFVAGKANALHDVWVRAGHAKNREVITPGFLILPLMPRTARACNVCYHVLNRGNARQQVFFKVGDSNVLLAFNSKTTGAELDTPHGATGPGHFALGIEKQSLVCFFSSGTTQRRAHTPINFF